MTWRLWPKTDERGLVRYANPEAALAASALDLGIDRLAEEANRDGRRMIATAIYDALRRRAESIEYDREKYLHHGEHAQLVRTPQEILVTARRGTCLDLTLLFCAYCLSGDLLPLLILVEGHAFAAVSMTHGRKTAGRDSWSAFDRKELQRFEQGGGRLESRDELIRLIDAGRYLPIECTGFARSRALPETFPEGKGRENGFLDFPRAVAAGREQLDARPFHCALDVHLLQEELGYGTYEPPGHAPRERRRETAGASRSGGLPGEYLSALAKKILDHSSRLNDRRHRDTLVDLLGRLPGASFVLRADDPAVDLTCILASVYRDDGIAEAFRLKLGDFIDDKTKCRGILAVAEDLPLLSTLRPLLARVDIDQRILQRVYRASVADPQRALEAPSLDGVLLDLLEIQPRSPAAARPLVEFVERLARKANMEELSRWVDEHAAVAAQVRELRQRLDRENPQLLPFDYLLIDIPSAQPDSIEYWHVDGSNRFREKGEEILRDRSDMNLKRAIDLIVNLAENWAADLRIEVFVSDTMLDCDPDRWPVSSFGEPLGDLHPVHLRWRDRAQGERATRPITWKSLVERARRSGGCASTFWLAEGQMRGPQLISALAEGQCGSCLGFLFIPFDRQTRSLHPLLRAALHGGMPFAVWLRRAPDAWAKFRDEVDSLTRDAALDDVPMRIKRGRIEGQVCDLTLFWDDPRRNPWEDHLESPGQRERP